MAKKLRGNCKDCEYGREFGFMDHGVTGTGDLWCSNSKSKRNRTGVKKMSGCKQFTQRGEQAPDYLLRLNQAFGEQE